MAEDASVQLRLLGPVELEVGGRPVVVRGQKRLGLLAYLGLRPRTPVRVEQLADGIWPGQGVEQATRTIRTYASQLRRELGLTHLVADRTEGAYRLDIPDDAVDSVRFEQLIRNGLTLPHAVARRAALTVALDLWRGPALTEVSDQSWASNEVASLDALRHAATSGLVTARLELGEHVALCGELELLVAEHPFDEGIWHALMLALYRSGRQAEALRTFQRARRILLDELSLDPGPELRALEAAILRHDPALAFAGAAPQPATPATQPIAPKAATSDLSWIVPAAYPLVGRERELSEIERWLTPTSERPRMAVLEGVPGIGKTRLLATIAEQRATDALVLFGRAEDSGGPYQLWRRVIERLLPSLPEETAPEALALLADLAGQDSADDGGADLRLTTARGIPLVAIARLLEDAGGRQPLLLVLDDLQWADEPSLHVLRYLLEGAELANCSIAATSRPLDLTGATALADALRAGQRVDRLIRLSITALDRTQATALALAGGANADRADALFDSSGGNPLLLMELLHREATSTEIDADTSLPGEVQRRLRRLDAEGADLLRVASLVGVSFDAILLGEALDLSEATVAAAMDTAISETLIRPVADDPGGYEFTHPIMAEAVLATISTGSNPLFHRAVALALEERRSEGRAISLDALARHWVGAGRAGDLASAIAALQAAGDQAVRQFGYEVASRHYGQAIDLLERQDGDPAEQAALLLKVAETENAAGDVGAAKIACVRAAAAARVSGRRDLLADAAIAHGGPIPMGADLEDPDGQALLREADAGPLDPARRARTRSRLAQLEYWLTDRETRIEWVRESIALATDLGDPGLRAEALLAGYWALNCPDLSSERLEILARLDAAVLELGDLDVLLQAGKCRLHLLLELGDLNGAVVLAARHRRLAERLGQSEHLRLALVFEANLATIEGRWDDADRLADDAADAMTRRGMRFHGSVVRHLHALAGAEFRGTLAEQQSWWERLAAAEPRRPLWRAMAAWIAAGIGEHDAARTHLELLDLDTFLAAEKRVDWWPVLGASSNCAIATADTAAAASLYEALLPFASFNLVTGQTAFWGAATWHLGRLATLLGDDEAAAEHLGDAQRRHRRMGALPFTSARVR